MKAPALQNLQRHWILGSALVGGLLLVSAFAILLTALAIEVNRSHYPNATQLSNCAAGQNYLVWKSIPITWTGNYSECFSTNDPYSTINAWYTSHGWLYDGTTNTFGKLSFHDLRFGYVFFYEQVAVDRATTASTLVFSNGFRFTLNDLP